VICEDRQRPPGEHAGAVVPSLRAATILRAVQATVGADVQVQIIARVLVRQIVLAAGVVAKERVIPTEGGSVFPVPEAQVPSGSTTSGVSVLNAYPLVRTSGRRGVRVSRRTSRWRGTDIPEVSGIAAAASRPDSTHISYCWVSPASEVRTGCCISQSEDRAALQTGRLFRQASDRAALQT
jgi:hypothetical protein